MCKQVMMFFLLISSIIRAEVDSTLILCATCRDTTGASVAYAQDKGGKYITSKDTLNVLAVFICFQDDTTWKAGNSYWDTLSAPTYLHTLFDSLGAYPSGAYNISNYFRTMSWTAPNQNDRFHMIGDGVFYITPHSRSWYKSQSMEISDINEEICRRLDDSLNIDFSKYDKWNFGTNHIHTESSSGDGYVDLIYLIYRNIFKDNKTDYQLLVDNIDGRNWSGCAGLMFSDTVNLTVSGKIVKGSYMSSNSSGLTMISFPYDLTVVGSRSMLSFIHEFGHFLGFGHHGYNSTLPCIMNSSHSAYFSIHPYEREYLKWEDYTPITTDSEISLDDYLTSGEAIKIKIHTSKDEYVYITNHQLESQFDIVNGNNPDSSSGVYISVNDDTTRNPLYLLSASGNYNWEFVDMIPNPWDVNTIPIWRDTLENPTSKSARDQLEYIVPGTSTKKNFYQHVYYDEDGNIDSSIHRCFGINEDAFDNDTDNFMISSYTNPSLLAYSGNKEGLSIEVSNFSGGDYTIKVRFDSSDTLDDLPPFRPMNAGASYLFDSVSVTWDANKESDVDYYQIWRSDEKATGYTKIKDNLSTNSYTDNTLQSSSTGFLYYKIKAVDEDSKVSTFSRFAKVDITPTAPVISVGIYNYYQVQLKIARKSSDTDKYKIYRKKGSGSYSLKATINCTGDTTTWLDPELSTAHQRFMYYYKVKAVNDFDCLSEYSNVVSIEADPNYNQNQNEHVEEISLIPTEYGLSAYPNPFNPSTNFRIGLPESGLVILNVYNSLGQKIYSINDFRNAGYHDFIFNGTDFTSGIYFYRLNVNSYHTTGKVLLIK